MKMFLTRFARACLAFAIYAACKLERLQG